MEPIGKCECGGNIYDYGVEKDCDKGWECSVTQKLFKEITSEPVYSRRKLEAERETLKRQLEAAVEGYNRILEEYKDSDRNSKSMYYRWAEDTLAKINQIGDAENT